MPTVVLTSRIPDTRKSGLLIDLRDIHVRQSDIPVSLHLISLVEIQRQHGENWINAFASGLGNLNAANSGVAWWAYTSTAKNLLSSPLGNRLFHALAVLKYIEVTSFDNLYVLGATAGQRAVIAAGTKSLRRDIVVRNFWAQAEFSTAEVVLRLLYHTIRMACVLISWRGNFKLLPADIHALTYADANVAEDSDSFFGELQQLLAQHDPAIKLSYLAFVQAPYRRVLPKLLAFRKNARYPLLLHLTIGDLWWALKLSLAASRPSKYHLPDISSIPSTGLLLAEAFRWDVAKGGYFYNLLVYRATGNFAREIAPKRMLYPFENKSLEKLFLCALRDACPTCRVIGYQHTSITPRHTTFQLTETEAEATPLPDLVVTVGDVTRNQLERTGHFPPSLFATGCALRQRHLESSNASATIGNSPHRILLALSSSRFELETALEFMRSVESLSTLVTIGVRPHPEFPLSLLPQHLRAWVSAHAVDFSGSSLTGNIDWCTVTAYVSSTVALETLMHGKPVINLDLGEIVNPDPVLDPPPLWKRVSNPQGFIAALDSMRNAQPQTSISDRDETLKYVQSYFRPVTAAAIKVFLS